VTNGWTCVGSPSTCTEICGNYFITISERCDDGNLVDGDGCSAGCEVEPGWLCVDQPSNCSTVCGDGVKTINELCDDGNTVISDGCSGLFFVLFVSSLLLQVYS
jgi:cysteine-rich repeat protein